MSFGDGNLHERVEYLMDRNGKMCAEINEKNKRIYELEGLIADMRGEMKPFERDVFLLRYIDKRIEELGIEV